MNTCSTCKFWDEKHASCHAYPPTHDGWPQACVDDWCGEHQMKCIEPVAGEDVFGKKDNPPGVWTVPVAAYSTTATMSFPDWRISHPTLGNLLFIRNDGDGTRLDWEQLFNRHGADAFTKAVEFAKEHGATKVFFNEMLEYFGKVKP
jgi:hypothetical protein